MPFWGPQLAQAPHHGQSALSSMPATVSEGALDTKVIKQLYIKKGPVNALLFQFLLG